MSDEESADYKEGHKEGENAAGWWIQDNIGGRSSGDVKAHARRTLEAIENCAFDMPESPLAGDENAEEYNDGYSAGYESAIAQACHDALEE